MSKQITLERFLKPHRNQNVENGRYIGLSYNIWLCLPNLQWYWRNPIGIKPEIKEEEIVGQEPTK